MLNTNGNKTYQYLRKKDWFGGGCSGSIVGSADPAADPFLAFGWLINVIPGGGLECGKTLRMDIPRVSKEAWARDENEAVSGISNSSQLVGANGLTRGV